MAKFIAGLLLILIILAVATVTLVSGEDTGTSGWRSQNGQSSPVMQATYAANATATFGAEQFNIQLTAIAEENE